MSESPRPEHVRLFLALDLPPQTRSAFARWRDSALGGRDDLRPLRDDALHVTLAFLGRRPRDQVEPVWQTVERALAGLAAPLLRAAGSKAIPPRSPRLLAIDLDDPDGAATAVYDALATGLEDAGLFERERRPFWPHVTVARARPRARLRGLEVSPPPGAAFTAREVTLYRSDLHPSGARYTALERLELRPQEA